jgi:hypothetical protein
MRRTVLRNAFYAHQLAPKSSKTKHQVIVVIKNLSNLLMRWMFEGEFRS